MPFFTNSDTDTGPFYLTNTDFGFHNILIDADFNVRGVIDCDGFVSAPLHVAAQIPCFSGLSLDTPGLETKKPLAIKYGKSTQLATERFLKILADTELSLKGEQLKPNLTDAILSDGAYMWRGLESYNSHQAWVNTQRLQSFWYMYFRRIKGQSYMIMQGLLLQAQLIRTVVGPNAVATFSDCPIPGFNFDDDDDDDDEEDDEEDRLPDETRDNELPKEPVQSMVSNAPETNEPADSAEITPASKPQDVEVAVGEENAPSIDAAQKDKEITKALDFLEGKI